METKQKHQCPHCHGKDTVKNGKTSYGKQNHQCKNCKRQFVERTPDPVEIAKEALLPALLMERVSLRGIGRILKKSMSWIYKRMEGYWALLPEDLPTGDLETPELEVVAMEVDEMWSFIGAKDCPQWIWLAIERNTRLVVGYHAGGRDEEGAQGLYYSIPDAIREKAFIYADDYVSYPAVFPKKQLRQEGKSETRQIERLNNTIRQRCSRLVRKARSFSKKWENHYLAIKYFLVNYNFEILANNTSLF